MRTAFHMIMILFVHSSFVFVWVVLHVATTLPTVIPTGINTGVIMGVVCDASVFRFRFSMFEFKLNIALILINEQDVTNALCLNG